MEPMDVSVAAGLRSVAVAHSALRGRFAYISGADFLTSYQYHLLMSKALFISAVSILYTRHVSEFLNAAIRIGSLHERVTSYIRMVAAKETMEITEARLCAN